MIPMPPRPTWEFVCVILVIIVCLTMACAQLILAAVMIAKLLGYV